jgi:hypothetical protein
LLPFPFEVDHAPDRESKSAERIRLEQNRIEGFCEKLSPFRERSRVLASIPAREQPRDAWPIRHHEIEDMDVSVVGQQARQLRQNPADVRRVDMVEKAVDEDEIEVPADRCHAVSDIGDPEPLAVPASRPGDVIGIVINAEVISVREVVGVRAGAAANVQNATCRGEIVVSEERPEFLLSEGRLPEPIRSHTLHDARVKLHLLLSFFVIASACHWLAVENRWPLS